MSLKAVECNGNYLQTHLQFPRITQRCIPINAFMGGKSLSQDTYTYTTVLSRTLFI